jgi:hypothetical protein
MDYLSQLYNALMKPQGQQEQRVGTPNPTSPQPSPNHVWSVLHSQWYDPAVSAPKSFSPSTVPSKAGVTYNPPTHMTPIGTATNPANPQYKPPPKLAATGNWYQQGPNGATSPLMQQMQQRLKPARNNNGWAHIGNPVIAQQTGVRR